MEKGRYLVFSYLREILGKKIPPYIPSLKGVHVPKRLWKGNAYLNVENGVVNRK